MECECPAPLPEEFQAQCDANTPEIPPPEFYCLRPTRYNYRAKVPWPSTYPAESTLHHDMPEYLLGPERMISNETWITHSAAIHNRKFYEEDRDYQPNHPLAPGLERVNYIRPTYHLKVQGVHSRNMKAYNPFPNRVSEMKAEFKPHWPEPSMYGQAGVFITDHHVYMPKNRVNVRPAFSYDDMFSVLRKSHPYMTTYRIYHKDFKDEIPHHKFLDQLVGIKAGPTTAEHKHKDDCAVKMIVRPMVDPFEQTAVKENILGSLDNKRETVCHYSLDTRNFAHQKQYFRRPPYYGAHPRVHQPVPHMGMNTTYKDTYDRPLHPNMALNHSSDEKFCFVQPPLSLQGLYRVPYVYDTENRMYGLGRNVCHYIDNDTSDHIKKIQDRRDEIQYNCGSNCGGGKEIKCGKPRGMRCPYLD